jgi:hypothetical protein
LVTRANINNAQGRRNIMRRAATLMAMALALLLLSAGLANAAQGVLACVARHYQGATIGSFQLSNFNDSATLIIDDVLVYDMDGNLLCEGPEGWGELTPWVLVPNGGTWFSTNRLATWCADFPEVTWVIVKIHWSSSGGNRLSSVFPLYGQTTTRMVDGEGVELGRSSLKCDTVEYRFR